jgi:RNA polymerase sigma factor (sigma-70 family)
MPEPSQNPSRLDAITTRWTVLRLAHDGSMSVAGEARSALVLRYLPAVRRYVGALVQKDQDADDLAQDVIVRLLAGDFGGADPERGRFRDLLKVAIRNMVRNYWSRQKRRRTVDLDVSQVGAGTEGDEEPWLAAWRRSVLDLAWKALEQEERSRPGSFDHTLLRLRTAHPDDSSEQLAARFTRKVGQPIRADALRQKLRRARMRLADLLILEVAHGLDEPTPERIEDELGALGLLETVRDFLPADWKEQG